MGASSGKALPEEDQVAELARRYSDRAEVYDRLWSPAIEPLGEHLLARLPLSTAADVLDVGTGAGALLPALQRLAPRATVLGVDIAEGMLRLARERHPGPLSLMNADNLELPDGGFDVAVVAFVLFHLPHPERCLAEVFRVLTPAGSVGTATWGAEHFPAVNLVWEEELDAAGAARFPLPATDNREPSNSETRMRGLLQDAGFAPLQTWTESLTHRWPPDDHFEYQVRATSRARLRSLDAGTQERCFTRIRERLATATSDDYTYVGDVIMATATKRPAGPH